LFLDHENDQIICNIYDKFEVLFLVQELLCDSKMRFHKECYCAYFFYWHLCDHASR